MTLIIFFITMNWISFRLIFYYWNYYHEFDFVLFNFSWFTLHLWSTWSCIFTSLERRYNQSHQNVLRLNIADVSLRILLCQASYLYNCNLWRWLDSLQRKVLQTFRRPSVMDKSLSAMCGQLWTPGLRPWQGDWRLPCWSCKELLRSHWELLSSWLVAWPELFRSH